MAFNMFTKKAPVPEQKSPVDAAVDMKSRGLDNNQIIQTLQRDGYSSPQIYEALNLADQRVQFQQPFQTDPAMQNRVNPMGLQPQSIVSPDFSSSPMGQPQPGPYGAPPPQYGQFAPPMQDQQDQGSDANEIEGLIEAVIAEKWKEIEKNVSKISEWKDRADQQMSQMQQQITDLKGQFDNLQKAVVGKVGDYDKNILEVGSQLNAMEKAFSKVLPAFTENINELNRITQRLKK